MAEKDLKRILKYKASLATPQYRFGGGTQPKKTQKRINQLLKEGALRGPGSVTLGMGTAGGAEKSKWIRYLRAVKQGADQPGVSEYYHQLKDSGQLEDFIEQEELLNYKDREKIPKPKTKRKPTKIKTINRRKKLGELVKQIKKFASGVDVPYSDIIGFLFLELSQENQEKILNNA